MAEMKLSRWGVKMLLFCLRADSGLPFPHYSKEFCPLGNLPMELPAVILKFARTYR